MFKIIEVEEVKFSSKVIKYFGLKLEVPYWTNFIAADEDGEIHAYESKPENNSYGQWHCYFDECAPEHILRVKFDGDWKDSLVEVE